MYAGEIVETGAAPATFLSPQHPYTVGLLGSLPRLTEKRERLPTIAGSVPSRLGPSMSAAASPADVPSPTRIAARSRRHPWRAARQRVIGARCWIEAPLESRLAA